MRKIIGTLALALLLVLALGGSTPTQSTVQYVSGCFGPGDDDDDVTDDDSGDDTSDDTSDDDTTDDDTGFVAVSLAADNPTGEQARQMFPLERFNITNLSPSTSTFTEFDFTVDTSLGNFTGIDGFYVILTVGDPVWCMWSDLDNLVRCQFPFFNVMNGVQPVEFGALVWSSPSLDWWASSTLVQTFVDQGENVSVGLPLAGNQVGLYKPIAMVSRSMSAPPYGTLPHPGSQRLTAIRIGASLGADLEAQGFTFRLIVAPGDVTMGSFYLYDCFYPSHVLGIGTVEDDLVIYEPGSIGPIWVANGQGDAVDLCVDFTIESETIPINWVVGLDLVDLNISAYGYEPVEIHGLPVEGPRLIR